MQNRNWERERAANRNEIHRQNREIEVYRAEGRNRDGNASSRDRSGMTAYGARRTNQGEMRRYRDRRESGARRRNERGTNRNQNAIIPRNIQRAFPIRRYMDGVQIICDETCFRPHIQNRAYNEWRPIDLNLESDTLTPDQWTFDYVILIVKHALNEYSLSLPEHDRFYTIHFSEEESNFTARPVIEDAIRISENGFNRTYIMMMESVTVLDLGVFQMLADEIYQRYLIWRYNPSLDYYLATSVTLLALCAVRYGFIDALDHTVPTILRHARSLIHHRYPV